MGGVLRSRFVIYIASALLFVGAWWVAALVAASAGAANILPSPAAVAATVVELARDGEIQRNLFITLWRVFAGFAIAEIIGIVIGTAMGLNPRLEMLADGWIMILLTIPSLAYCIFALLAFGLSETAMIVAIAATTLPYVVVNIWSGVKAVDAGLLDMARAFRVNRWNTLRKVVLPQIMPYIFSSSRYGIGIAWKIAVVVELMGASRGVGYMLNYSFGLFSMTHVLAWTSIVVMVMLFIELVAIRLIEEHVLAWRPKAH
ncbi:MAG: ABC transporter permease [Pseudorhodoplanes sp.]|uniref:ABC transporter permease n=1 Tax=Pseudorhodoplanes sp. TaxID=1934341 RepID=UPI003D0F4A43